MADGVLGANTVNDLDIISLKIRMAKEAKAIASNYSSMPVLVSNVSQSGSKTVALPEACQAVVLVGGYGHSGPSLCVMGERTLLGNETWGTLSDDGTSFTYSPRATNNSTFSLYKAR